jgi:hypothetical protein
MEELPHGLQRDRHVELAGRRGEPRARRLVIALLALVVVAALLVVAPASSFPVAESVGVQANCHVVRVR